MDFYSIYKLLKLNFPVTEKIIPLAGVNILMLSVKGQPPNIPPLQQLKGKNLVRMLELYEKIFDLVRNGIISVARIW
jgi:hypothetical protein